MSSNPNQRSKNQVAPIRGTAGTPGIARLPENLRSSYARLILEPAGLIGLGTAIAVLVGKGGPSVYVWTLGLIFGLYAMSCNILLGWAGRMSFGQAACLGAGAYAATLASPYGIPSLLLPVVGGLAGVLAIIPVGIIALRSSGLMFSMLTFIWSGIIFQFVFSTDALGGDNGLVGALPYSLLGMTFTAYWAQAVYVALITVLCLGLLRWLQATTFGTMLQATRDDSIRAALLGIPVRRVHLIAIVLSGFVAGLAGALLAQAQSTVDPALFFWSVSGDGIVMALIGGQFTFWGPMVGGLILTALRQLIFAGSQQSALLIGLMLLAIVVFAPAGLLGVAGRLLLRWSFYERLSAWLNQAGRRVVLASTEIAAPGELSSLKCTPGAAAMEVHGLGKSYLGVHAIADVTTIFAAQQCTAVIGPNGAGKTTLFSILSGEIKSNTGQVLLRGKDVTSATASSRVHDGVSRTFQVARFFTRLSVQDNVLVAAAAVNPGAGGWLTRFGFHRGLVAQADAALDAVGLGHVRSRVAGTLTQAERKRLELAMVLVQRPSVLLLDEPTAGLAKSDALSVLGLLKTLHAQGDLTIVVTSHDMDVVFGMADHVVLMAQGRVAMSGAPQEVRNSAISREVYLGGNTAKRIAAGSASL